MCVVTILLHNPICVDYMHLLSLSVNGVLEAFCFVSVFIQGGFSHAKTATRDAHGSIMKLHTFTVHPYIIV